MNQLIIGLWGPAGVGKDTVADALGFPKASFAATLKQDLAPIFKNLNVDISDREQKEKVRPLMISLGKTAREIDPYHWIKRVSIPNAKAVTFCDVRYFNEILAILFRGGVVYELQRAGFSPANDEEKRSFTEIREMVSKIGVTIPVIDNTNVAMAVKAIREDIRSRSIHFAQSLSQDRE